MVQEYTQKITKFLGIRNDEDSKQIGGDYFSDGLNFNYSNIGVLGIDTILAPLQISLAYSAGIYHGSMNGIYEFRYLDSNNVAQKKYIFISGNHLSMFNGNTGLDPQQSAYIYGGCLDMTTGDSPTTNGSLVTFATYQDKLFIADGVNYIAVLYPDTYLNVGTTPMLSQMGAPVVSSYAASGNLSGSAYVYAMSYITAGGEEVVGSRSNTFATGATGQTYLHIPLGYDGTLQRKIYRTAGTGGGGYKLVTTITDNTTTFYIDNVADGSLGATMPAVNNELPKVKFLTTCKYKLFATGSSSYPTQTFATSTNNEVLDSANFIDVGNNANDNTPVNGLGNDFDKVIVGTSKQIYLIDPSNYVANTVVLTRAGVGIKNGYTCKYIPAFNDFIGGLTFLSSNNDIRVMSGLQSLPVSTSLDNVSTDSWSQAIRGSMENAIKSGTKFYAEYFNYKYYLLVDYIKYVLDIRTKGWNVESVITANYQSTPNVITAVNLSADSTPNFKLLNGQYLYNPTPSGTAYGGIEQEYAIEKYQSHKMVTNVGSTYSEDLVKYVQSGHINVDTNFKFINKLKFWFLNNNVAQSAMVASQGASGAIGAGAYSYLMTFIDRNGNETISYYGNSNTVTISASKKINLIIPSCPSGYTIKLYRTKAGGSIYYYLQTLTTFNTTLVDNTNDSGISSALSSSVLSGANTLTLTINLDDNPNYTIVVNFDINNLSYMDYKTVNINRSCKFFTWKLTCNTGLVSLQGVEICGQALSNKEK